MKPTTRPFSVSPKYDDSNSESFCMLSIVVFGGGVRRTEGAKGKHMPIDLIHRKPKNKNQATQPVLTNTSPSPLGGKLEGGSHAT
jgi:hypothetical protein